MKNGLLCELTNGKPIASRSCGDDYKFGQINSKPNRASTIVYEIQDHATGQPVTLPAFVVSVFDIDQGKEVTETYVVKGWESAVFVENPVMDISTDGTQEACTPGESCLVAASTTLGKGCNNPTSPLNLGVPEDCDDEIDVVRRSFQVTFENTSTFEITMDIGSGGSGRNMLWGFISQVSQECVQDPLECE